MLFCLILVDMSETPTMFYPHKSDAIAQVSAFEQLCLEYLSNLSFPLGFGEVEKAEPPLLSEAFSLSNGDGALVPYDVWLGLGGGLTTDPVRLTENGLATVLMF